MAYTLWPEQVRPVCRHDRSIAIARALEHLDSLAKQALPDTAAA